MITTRSTKVLIIADVAGKEVSSKMSLKRHCKAASSRSCRMEEFRDDIPDLSGGNRKGSDVHI